MNDIVMWIVIGVVGAVILAFVIYYIVKLCKMTPEERKKTLVTWLKGAVALAEEEIGSGHGEEKLAEVEKYFKKNAPWFLKILFLFSGAENLQELIEEALTGVKNSFGNSSESSKGEENSEEE